MISGFLGNQLQPGNTVSMILNFETFTSALVVQSDWNSHRFWTWKYMSAGSISCYMYKSTVQVTHFDDSTVILFFATSFTILFANIQQTCINFLIILWLTVIILPPVLHLYSYKH